MRKIVTLSLVVLCLSPIFVFGQDDIRAKTSDELFQMARTLAFDGQKDSARVLLNLALEKSPGYADIKIFLARTHAWDGQRETSIALLKEVLSEDKNNEEALDALTDVLGWDDQVDEQLNYIDKALKSYPNNINFLNKKASVLIDKDQDEEASVLINQALKLEPGNEKTISLRSTLSSRSIKSFVNVNYNTDIFSDVFDQANFGSISIGRFSRLGTYQLRGNYANRFDTTGYQLEADFYPTLTKNIYAYANYGYSDRALFPTHRAGLEFYFSLPKSLEASIGGRYLYFSKSSHVRIFTGTLGWYFKNYWLSGRIFVTPNEVKSYSRSGILKLRRYFSNADTYVGLTVGYGYSPDIRSFQSDADLGSSISFLNSRKVLVEFQKRFGLRYIATLNLQYAQQEFDFDLGNYVGITSVSVTLEYRF